ncbi:MAG: BamA/TamA family outer membrane protein [Armatimonadetes bacterium]|nr:BamA/TamA family outer membrane protein [Armatimonadota bacterium]MDW8122816.1 BamA/TamA family outer membrane protein [Armatimonadota bacterium]
MREKILLFLLCYWMASFALAQDPEGKEVAEVRIEGNRYVSSESILLLMDTKPGMPFSLLRLQKDLEAIDDMGFFAAPPQAQPFLTPDGRVLVVVRVFENPVVKEIRFQGNTAILSEKLLALMRTEKGQILNSLTLQRDLERIQEFYWDSGFAGQPLAPQMEPDGTLVIPIQEFKVVAIKIDLGKKPKTKEKTVLRELTLKKGDLFNRRAIDTDRRRLFLLDIFEEVNVEPRDAVDPKTGEVGVEVTYRLKEKRTGMANAGLGFSSRNELVGVVAVQDTNFRGTAQQIRIMGEFFDRKGFDLYYFRPWVDSKRTGFAINLFDRRFFRSPTSAVLLGAGQSIAEDLLFTEDRRGMRLSFRRPRGEYLFQELKVRAERVHFIQERLIGGTILAGARQDQGTVTGIAFSRVLDQRDFPFDPTKGLYLDTEVELSPRLLGSSHTFLKLLVDWRRYVPRGRNTVLATRVLFGTVWGATPVFENFFVGGAETLRGYTIDRFVGRHLLVFNAEWRYRFRKELQGVLFWDIGDAFGGPHSIDLKQARAGVSARRDTFRPKIGYGVGIRILTPFAPLRFDFGFGEEGRRTHFSVGAAF